MQKAAGRLPSEGTGLPGRLGKGPEKLFRVTVPNPKTSHRTGIAWAPRLGLTHHCLQLCLPSPRSTTFSKGQQTKRLSKSRGLGRASAERGPSTHGPAALLSPALGLRGGGHVTGTLSLSLMSLWKAVPPLAPLRLRRTRRWRGAGEGGHGAGRLPGVKALPPATSAQPTAGPQLSAPHRFLGESWVPAGGSLVHPPLSLSLQL